MKKTLLVTLITLINLNCYSQISFEKGYYIDSTDQKINCLIKNIDWKNNPTEFDYMLSEDSEPKKATIKSVKEFGIDNSSKYIRSTVNIDRSTHNIDRLSYGKKPIFKKEELFLKVLVEGKATLYGYIDGSLRRYFYNKENSGIEQLVFKKYKTQENSIRENNSFRQQLWNDLKCSTFTMSKIKNVGYTKKGLVNFFVEYAECNNQDYISYKEKKDLFNLNIRPRINNSSLSIQSNSIYKDADFGNKLGFRFGIEAEFILPFNKNKWAIIIEPTYQRFKSEKELRPQGGRYDRSVKVDYKSIELPIGIRHYFFINEGSKIFINSSVIIDLSSNSIIDFKYEKDVEIKSKHNLALGVGYKHKDKYSLELRYQKSRELFNGYLDWSSKYNTLAVIFGYSLF